MKDMTDFEREVLNKVLDGDRPVLAALRKQVESARLLSREYTGVGFFADFALPPNTARVTSPDFTITDVSASVAGLRYGVGFVLFVRGGLICDLEGFTIGEEQWPDPIGDYKLQYSSNPRDLDSLGILEV